MESLKKRQDEWFRQHELTDDQLEKLIENKFIRASEYYKSYKVREHEVENFE